MAETLNVLTAAINKLPTKEEFRAFKNEAKNIVRISTQPTKEYIRKYKESERRTQYIYGG